MKRRGKPKYEPSKKHRVSITAFNIMLVEDESIYAPSIGNDPLVLMVNNFADNPPNADGSRGKGKPAGIGMPGGGVKT